MSTRISRRRLLRGTLASAVALASWKSAAREVFAGSGSLQRQVDVVIVGAGLSGLTAALRLTQTGRSVVVLEAGDHVGGRMLREQTSDGAYVDLGGQWVGPTQDRILALADELSVQRFPWYHDGETVFIFNGDRGEFDGNFPPFEGEPPPLPPAEVEDAEQAWQAVEDLAATVPIEAPWDAPNASQLDSETAETWMDANASGDFARFVIAQNCRIGGSGAFEPSQASALHLAWTQANAPQSEEPERYLFVGAAGQIPGLIAAQLGDSVTLNAPVWGIEQDGITGVRVHGRAGVYGGQFAIVAVPPTLAGGIHYDPPLPARRQQLTQRMPMGSLLKVNAIYPYAFWRQSGLSGVGTGDLPVAQFTADSSPPGGSPGILTSFIAGDAAVSAGLVSSKARQEAVLRDFVDFFGDEAAAPIQFIEKNWPSNPRTGGAFTDFMAPGVWTSYGQALRAPIGRLFWAGTETAYRWSGYFDGAVRAGEDAAAAVMALL
jgi:L-amino acid dehydrogenase